ncbi:MAG TPA: hypothetical protein ENK31_01115 [Nannocystis exedens]|nr:hypothetical protein [Nannocystis exedens]
MALLWLCFLPGCAGELGALTALALGMAMGAWMVGRERQRRLYLETAGIRRAISQGGHRGIERRLRRELALAAAGPNAHRERLWFVRAQLAELLLAQWRLDEARQVYATQDPGTSAHLQALAAFGRHELEVLASPVDEARLLAIRRDRDACLEVVPEAIKLVVQRAWGALEGVALLRSNRPREAIPLLEEGLDSVSYNPARIVYIFHLAQAYERVGALEWAMKRYNEASLVFPGTRLANEASARLNALTRRFSGFRDMLPEMPVPGHLPSP